MNLDRRNFLKLGAAAAAELVLPPLINTAEASYTPRLSEHNEFDIEADRLNAAQTLIFDLKKRSQRPDRNGRSPWKHALHNYFAPGDKRILQLSGKAQEDYAIKMLAAEATMRLPSKEEYAAVFSDECRQDLISAIEKIPLSIDNPVKQRKEGIGFLVIADMNDPQSSVKQKEFVLRKTSNGEVFVDRVLTISTSSKGIATEPGMVGTPAGRSQFVKMDRGRKMFGLLGEVMSITNTHQDEFTTIEVEGHEVTFVNNRNGIKNSDPPEIITATYRMVGPNANVANGKDMHGRSKLNKLGTPDTGGCLGLSDVDIAWLRPYIVEGDLRKDGVSVGGDATPLVVHASERLKRFEPVGGKIPKAIPEWDEIDRNERRPRSDSPRDTQPRPRFNPFKDQP